MTTKIDNIESNSSKRTKDTEFSFTNNRIETNCIEARDTQNANATFKFIQNKLKVFLFTEPSLARSKEWFFVPSFYIS